MVHQNPEIEETQAIADDVQKTKQYTCYIHRNFQ